MSIVGTLRELALALDEIKQLRLQFQGIKSAYDKLNDRVRTLEERDRLRDAEFNHLAERTKTAAEAGVQIGIARMETVVQGKLVELDLRLKAVESGGASPASRRLPSQ